MAVQVNSGRVKKRPGFVFRSFFPEVQTDAAGEFVEKQATIPIVMLCSGRVPKAAAHLVVPYGYIRRVER